MHFIRQNACEASHQRPSVVFTRRDSNPAVIALHPTDSTSTFTCDYEKEPFETHFCCCTSMVCLTCRSGVLGRKKSAPLQAVQPHFWPPCGEFLYVYRCHLAHNQPICLNIPSLSWFPRYQQMEHMAFYSGAKGFSKAKVGQLPAAGLASKSTNRNISASV